MKESVNTTIDRDLLCSVRRLAKERGLSVSAVMERALDRFLIAEEKRVPRFLNDGKEVDDGR